MRISCIGGGPAGLYFAILMKKLDPRNAIVVYERNRPDETFGWGVVFSDETRANFAAADPETHAAIETSFVRWTDIEIQLPGGRFRCSGHGFCGLARRRLLAILAQRAAGLGVELRYETEAEPGSLPAADLIVAADGVNSRIRERWADHFRPEVDWRLCRFSWLGTDLHLPAFTFIFKESAHGLFQVHAYPFDAGHSTFIVECREEVWRRAGLDRASEAETLAYLGRLFADELGGHRLLGNRSLWRRFPSIRNECWHHDNLVLLGDAAHTAHFSIGSGTKLAMEDAISLCEAFRSGAGRPLTDVLESYEADRKPYVARLQAAAQTSLEWFENAGRHLRQAPLSAAFSLLTRSARISYDNLALRDPALIRAVTDDFAERAAGATAGPGPPAPAAPPAFQPLRLRGLTLANRLVVSPMCQYSSDDGTPNDWHLVHLGSRAMGGAGLVFTEATHVAPEARITPHCAGMYKPEHVAAWRRVVDFVHQHSRAAIGMQLAHAGRKGSCTRPWEGDAPLSEGGWELLAPSALAYAPGWPLPRSMDRADMERAQAQFVRAAAMAADAGFDVLELHMAHGYLLATFLSPLTNRRQDGYGGDIEGRLRFPLEVLRAVRGVWPDQKPLSVRISATDWVEGGTSSADRISIATAFRAQGADLVDVSAGGTVPGQKPRYGRMHLAGFSEEIRAEARIPTLAVGNIQSADHVNTLLAAGRADLCALARAHLADPYLTLRAAAAYGVELPWPSQYLPAKPRR